MNGSVPLPVNPHLFFLLVHNLLSPKLYDFGGVNIQITTGTYMERGSCYITVRMGAFFPPYHTHHTFFVRDNFLRSSSNSRNFEKYNK